MSNATLIIGESGTGKSTAIETLDSLETYVINIIDKPLPFKGYKKFYRAAPDGDLKRNYLATDNPAKIIECIKAINANRLDIKVLVIDDFQFIMANEYMRRARERGFDKFAEIGQSAYLIFEAIKSLREDLSCFVLSHSVLRDDGTYGFKSIGKMLDNYITVEAVFTNVLHTAIIDEKHMFITQNDGKKIAKSPKGMFENKYIPNDLAYVNKCISDYANDN